MQHHKKHITKLLLIFNIFYLFFLNNGLISQIRSKFILNKYSHKDLPGIYIKTFFYLSVFKYIIFNYFNEHIKFCVYHVHHILKHGYNME